MKTYAKTRRMGPLAVLVAAGLLGTTVLAAKRPTATPGEGDDVRRGRANLRQIEDSGVRATIRFTDDGETLRVNGTARGLDPAQTYITLIYDNGSVARGPCACAPTIFDPEDPEFLLGRMLIGSWQVNADGTGTLSAVNTNSGADYVPLGMFRTTSVRRVLGPPPAPGAPPPTELLACGRVRIQDDGHGDDDDD